LYQNPSVKLERRNRSPRIYARTFLRVNGKTRHLTNTGEETLEAARKVALKWYLGLLMDAEREAAGGTGPNGASAPTNGVLFADAVNGFLKWADAAEEHSPLQRRNFRHKWSLLQSEFDGVTLRDVDITFLERLRSTRKASTTIIDALGRKRVRPRPVTNNTLKKDLDFIRGVLKWAHREKLIDALPMFPAFKGKKWKVRTKQSRRPFLPPALWRQVKRTALARASETNLNPRVRRQRQELYAFVCLCVGAALRVEEAYNLKWKDCRLGRLKRFNTECVYLWVHGKHTDTEDGVEEGWALYDGVVGFKYLQKVYPKADPDEPLFRERHRDGFRLLLETCDPPLRHDLVTGMARSTKSLRSTGISLRLAEGDNLTHDDVAVWARTSPAQIKDWYDQIDPNAKVERVAGFRGDSENEPEREKKARRDLNRVRKQVRIEEMADNDDVFGVNESDEPWEEGLSTTSRANLRLVARKKR
jgi:hypothetical protein